MIIVVTGPTGVGKTKLSVMVAKEFNGEIINADSMQVYKRLNIGTAKITETEKNGVAHHLFDIANVDDNYTIYNYQNDCRAKIKEIEARKHVPIIVGGSGLYIKSALYDYNLQNEKEKDQEFQELSNKELLKRILELESSIIIAENNRKRLVRTYNRLIKNNYSQDKTSKLVYDNVIFIGLTTDRSILYDKINRRVDEMVNNGLLQEVEELYNDNINSKAINTGIGYKELYKYFAKEISLEQAIDLIKKNSRHYAKRQYTWFNNQMNIKWFNANYEDFSKTVLEIVNYINSISSNWQINSK